MSKKYKCPISDERNGAQQRRYPKIDPWIPLLVDNKFCSKCVWGIVCWKYKEYDPARPLRDLEARRLKIVS
ncbi:hypothetical protein LCGC14_2865100 [marine sediment metagenome]|uniref:Uncharacterized protein n=1 Tax=marine sediment metagenome TaxID=412755 RepID=A0A0F8YR86_9ZZZZ